MGRFEILEHTADVGLSAEGEDLPDLFITATEALASIAGVWRPDDGESREAVPVELEAHDVGALLVDWLSEVIFLHDSRGMAVGGVSLSAVTERRAAGTLVLVPLPEGPGEGTQVKAVTYHRLRVEPTEEGWVAEVYLDI